MKAEHLYITSGDFEKLDELFETPHGFDLRNRKHVRELRQEISSARVVPSNRVGPDVVTMNSRIILQDLDNNEEFECEIVYPDQADLNQDKISVLAPVATAILGRKVGETVVHDVPRGKRRLHIKEMLYQPELNTVFV